MWKSFLSFWGQKTIFFEKKIEKFWWFKKK